MNKRIEAKIVIIGVGILGSSVLRELLARGESDIVVLEKEDTFGGASAHSFGMLRAFHNSDRMTELAYKSYQTVMTSGDMFFAEKKPFLSVRAFSDKLLNQIKALESCHYPLEILSPEKTYAKFGLQVASDSIGILEPEALTFDAQALVQHMHQTSLSKVTVIRDSASHLLEHTHGIDIICTNGNSIRASAVIVASGAGSIPLLSGRCISLEAKKISYYSTNQNFDHLPQILNARTHEFLAQKNNKSYYRFTESNSLRAQLKLNLKAPKNVTDISSEISKESFGRIPGSKRIYFMGAWSGNAFKLSWELARRICDCALNTKTSTNSHNGAHYENRQIL